jgi:hypothetical protein
MFRKYNSNEKTHFAVVVLNGLGPLHGDINSTVEKGAQDCWLGIGRELHYIDARKSLLAIKSYSLAKGDIHFVNVYSQV